MHSDAEAREVVTAARRAGEEPPPIGLLGGDSVSNARGPGRRRPAAVRGGHPGHRRPRRGPGRRSRPLVRRPPHRSEELAAGPDLRGTERPVGGGRGNAAPRPTPETVAWRPSTFSWDWAIASRPDRDSGTALTCPTPASSTAARPQPRSISIPRLRCGSTGCGLVSLEPCRSGSSPTHSRSSSETAGAAGMSALRSAPCARPWPRSSSPTRSIAGRPAPGRLPPAPCPSRAVLRGSTSPTTCSPTSWRGRGLTSSGGPTGSTPPSWLGPAAPDRRLPSMCEYDALPEIGHACGHNIIGSAGLGAGLALAARAEELGGRVVVLGTPAEEGGGGKAIMADRGALDGVDVAMMIHPAPSDLIAMNAIAIQQIHVEYHGEAAHAAAFPHRGRNALDAAVARVHERGRSAPAHPHRRGASTASSREPVTSRTSSRPTPRPCGTSGHPSFAGWSR